MCTQHSGDSETGWLSPWLQPFAFCYFANGNNDGVTVNVFSVYGSAILSAPLSLSFARVLRASRIFLLVHGNKTWQKAPRTRWNNNNNNSNNNRRPQRKEETKDTKANAGKYHTWKLLEIDVHRQWNYRHELIYFSITYHRFWMAGCYFYFGIASCRYRCRWLEKCLCLCASVASILI